jgi:hypothetical protein
VEWVPDIADVVLAFLSSPATEIVSAVRKVTERIKAEMKYQRNYSLAIKKIESTNGRTRFLSFTANQTGTPSKRSAVRSPSTYCLLTINIKVGSRNHLNPYVAHSLFY